MIPAGAGGRVRGGATNFGVSLERVSRAVLAVGAAALLIGCDLSSPGLVHPKDGGPDAAGSESTTGGSVGAGGRGAAGTGGIVGSGGNVAGGAGGNSAGAGGTTAGNGG